MRANHLYSGSLFSPVKIPVLECSVNHHPARRGWVKSLSSSYLEPPGSAQHTLSKDLQCFQVLEKCSCSLNSSGCLLSTHLFFPFAHTHFLITIWCVLSLPINCDVPEAKQQVLFCLSVPCTSLTISKTGSYSVHVAKLELLNLFCYLTRSKFSLLDCKIWEGSTSINEKCKWLPARVGFTGR